MSRSRYSDALRVLHVVPSYFPATRYGGPIYSVHGLCRALASLGHEVEVFTTNVDGSSDSDLPLGQPVVLDGVRVWYFPSRRLRRLYWSPWMARELTHQVRRFDLMHLQSVFLWPTLAAARAARKVSVPYLLAPRGMLVKELIERKSPWAKKAWIRLFERRSIAGAAAIHVTSEVEGFELRRFGFDLPPLAMIPNGVDLPRPYDETFPSSPDVAALVTRRPLVLFLGRINWKKGLDRLIPAMKFVPAAHLCIVGNDEEQHVPSLRRLVAECGLSERIVFLPRSVQGVDKECLYAAAQVFVLPSYSENFGNAALEAMARSRPVVVTSEVGLADWIRESGAGLVSDGAPEHLGAALQQLVSDPRRARTMGEAARRCAEQCFSWPAIALEMERLYRRVLRDKEVPGPG